MGVATDLSEPLAFKNVALQMMIDQTFTFRRISKKKKMLYSQDFDVPYERPKWKRYPFTAFSFRENLPFPHPWLKPCFRKKIHRSNQYGRSFVNILAD